jgi:hypothetical protein
VVRAIKTFAFFVARPPTPTEWRQMGARGDWPSLSIVESLFGSFAAAVAAAGFKDPAAPGGARVTERER